MFNFETHMDFVGQYKAEKYSRFFITTFGLVGFILGGVLQRFSYTVYSLGIGFVLACLLTIPPWPMYRCNPLNWQKPRHDNVVSSNNVHEETKSKKKK